MSTTMNGNSLHTTERPNPGTPVSRQMVWSKTTRMEAWTCFGCAWEFSPSGPPRGGSLDEMMSNYELQRDKEYAFHVCAQHPRANSKLPGRLDERTLASISPGTSVRNHAREGL